MFVLILPPSPGAVEFQLTMHCPEIIQPLQARPDLALDDSGIVTDPLPSVSRQSLQKMEPLSLIV